MPRPEPVQRVCGAQHESDGSEVFRVACRESAARRLVLARIAPRCHPIVATHWPRSSGRRWRSSW